MQEKVLEIDNYEVVISKEKAVITYDISELNNLKNIDNVLIYAQNISSNKFNLNIADESGKELAILKNIDETLVSKIIERQLFLAGFDPYDNQLSEVSTVKDFSLIKQNKNKLR